MFNVKRKTESGKCNGFFHFQFRINYLPFLLFTVFLFPFSVSSFAHDLPKEIRGYKVYNAKVSVENKGEKIKNNTDAFVKIGEPKITDISIAGVTVEVSGEITVPEQNGTIDFLTFKDFRINNLAVSIEEYREPFAFKKNQTVALPKPVKIFIATDKILRGAVKEFNNAENEWTITGTAFVFGRFKKFGFNFKRVVPIEINLKIKNPIKQESK